MHAALNGISGFAARIPASSCVARMKAASLRSSASSLRGVERFCRRVISTRSQKGNAVAATARAVPLPPPAPDLMGEFAPTLRRRAPDHLHRRWNGHLVRLALHTHHSGEPLAQTRGALGLRVVLPGEPAQSGTPERVRATDIAAPARPEDIGRFAVFLPAVNVTDLNVAPAPAKAADPRTRRRTGVGAVPLRTVADRFLTPAPPARRSRQSRSSSSSPSSGSSGATIEATSSSWSCRVSFSPSRSSTCSCRSAISSSSSATVFRRRAIVFLFCGSVISNLRRPA